MKAVAVLTARPDYFLAAKKEFKSLKDLKGKRIAIGTFGAVKAVVDQARTELKIKGPVPLDKVRDWSFAEKAISK